MRNLVFIGGIHGVGKGTICRKISLETNLIHITASEVLRWDELSKPENKKVTDIKGTQARLISGLNKIIDKKAYLLDGHFCLFNAKGEIKRIPEETFVQIDPKIIAVVIDDVERIQERINRRDNRLYDIITLEKMQNAEIEYSKDIASILNVPLFEIKDGNYQPLKTYYNASTT